MPVRHWQDPIVSLDSTGEFQRGIEGTQGAVEIVEIETAHDPIFRNAPISPSRQNPFVQ